MTGSATPPWIIVGAVVVALALRLAMVFLVHPLCPFDPDQWAKGTGGNLGRFAPGAAANCFEVNGDANALYQQGRAFAEGYGIIYPPTFVLDGTVVPSAGKPPLMTVVVAGLATVGLTSPDAFRFVEALCGTGAVAGLGLLTRRIAGARAGAIAACIAALYPMLWINDWRMLNESFLDVAIVGFFAACYRFWMRPDVRASMLLAASVVLAAYSRVECYLLFPVVVLPLATIGTRRLRRKDRAKLVVVIGLTAATLMAPWVIRNLTSFVHPVTVSGGSGSAKLNGSCDEAWFGNSLGYYSFACFDPILVARANQIASGELGYHGDESEVTAVYDEAATEYISRNKMRFPVVAAARVGRMWDLYRPWQNLDFNIQYEGRGDLDSRLGLLSYYLLLPPAALGLVGMRKRRLPVLPFVGVAIVTTFAASITFGVTRYRASLDVALCLCAGVGLSMLSGVRRGEGSLWHRLLAAMPDGSPAVMAARDRQRPSLLDRVSHRIWRRSAVAGAFVAVLGVGVVVWSAGVEPVPPPGGSGSALCVDARRALSDMLASQTEAPSPAKLAAVRETLKSIGSTAPEMVATLATLIEFIDGLEGSGQSIVAYQASLPQERTAAISSAGSRLTTFLERSCG